MESNLKIHTAGQLSDQLNGEIIGDPSLQIDKLASIESDEPNSITFFGNPKYEQFVYGNHPRAVLVPFDFHPKSSAVMTFIKVHNVYDALSKVSDLLNGEEVLASSGVSLNSFCHDTSTFGSNVAVGHFSVIEANCNIGDNVLIMNQVSISNNVSIGHDTIIHSGVKILSGVKIGASCIIHPNAVIGSEGFGFSSSEGGYNKIRHQGSVIIEDDVEIGSNTCIDRGSVGNTIIRKGAKLDNLIQVAHGVEIGEHVAIAAQSGISGSSKIGHHSQLGGQSGVVGHVSIAPHSKIQAQSGVAADIKRQGQKWYGFPAISYYRYLRSFAIFKRLPELLDRIRRLENK